jgi:hypothetical protein
VAQDAPRSHDDEQDYEVRMSRRVKNFNYPEKTAGSKAAKKLRAETNKLSESKRENLFKRGMQIIYGGTRTEKAVRAR